MIDYAKALYEPFPKEMEGKLRKGGTTLTYIPQAEVITRLNNVFGVSGWEFTIKNLWREDNDFVMAHGRLGVKFEGSNEFVYRDGIGGQKINRIKSGEPMDLGDDYKGASSDALKKAASTFGIGLYLARDAEALEMEEAMREEPAPAPAPSQEWLNFTEQVSQLDKDGKDALNAFWAKYSGGRPKPTQNNYTQEDLEALSGEAVRLIMGGSYVNDAS